MIYAGEHEIESIRTFFFSLLDLNCLSFFRSPSVAHATRRGREKTLESPSFTYISQREMQTTIRLLVALVIVFNGVVVVEPLNILQHRASEREVDWPVPQNQQQRNSQRLSTSRF